MAEKEMSMIWIIVTSVGFGLLTGLVIGASVGFACGYDWAASQVARVVATEQIAESPATQLHNMTKRGI